MLVRLTESGLYISIIIYNEALGNVDFINGINIPVSLLGAGGVEKSQVCTTFYYYKIIPLLSFRFFYKCFDYSCASDYH